MKKAILLSVMLTFASLAHGAELPTGFYMGASYLKAKASMDEGFRDRDYAAEVSAADEAYRAYTAGEIDLLTYYTRILESYETYSNPVTYIEYTFSDRDRTSGYRLFIGYRFLPYLAAEFSYVDAGDFDTTVISYDIDGVTGAQFNLLANTPLIKERVSLFAKLGVISLNWREKTTQIFLSANFEDGSIQINEVNESNPENDKALTYGAGVLVRVTDRWTARLELDKWNDIGHRDIDIDVYTLGVQYHF